MVPALRSSRTRSCQDRRPPYVATQVSVLTRARSSVCAPRLVRRNDASPLAQRPRVSQLLRVPLSPTPRTSTCTRVPSGVVAVHDGTSSLSANPGLTHGEVQLPTSYDVRPIVVVARGELSRSLPARAVVPENVPVASSAAVSHCR